MAQSKEKGGEIMAGRQEARSKFMKPVRPDEKLALIVGKEPLPRTQVVKKLWAYIKRNKLQDSKNRRNINADTKLRPLFGGKGTVNMFQMIKLVSKHLH